MRTLLAVASCLLLGLSAQAQAQVNTSQEINYKARSAGVHTYTTVYDNGYVQLLDGTRIEGKISLIGTSYSNVYGVRIKTNTGQKYSFFPRSLSEFGLSNSIVNDTPGEFYWTEVDRGASKYMTGKSAGGNQAVSDGRKGYANFGYVVTKGGKTYEGQIDIKEIKQRVEKIEVKTIDKQKHSFTADEIASFGVKRWVDPKFNSSFSLLLWDYGESSETPGFVELNDGERVTGNLVLLLTNEVVSQVQVLPPNGKGKKRKIKYADIKAYGVDVDIEHVNNLLKAGGVPFDLIHPERKFHPGAVQLEDGTIKEGLVARVKPGQLTDVLFAETESAAVEYLVADDVGNVIQTMPDGTMDDYARRVWDATHIQGYPIDQTSRWQYKSRNEGSSKTESMWGYLVLEGGEKKVGYVAIRTVGALKSFFLKQDAVETKYKGKEVRDYGLLASTEKEEWVVAIADDAAEEDAQPEESVLATRSTDANVESNGYVITASGEKKEGAVSISAPLKLWFATEVTLTSPDGAITTYANDGSLSKVVLTVDGEEKEFIGFENEYVEVLHREGDLVHFRNPHPTTMTRAGDLANLTAGAALESVDQAFSKMGGGITKDAGRPVDWTKEEIVKNYAKEFLIFNEATGRTTMYIPGRNYRQVEGDLMGSIEFLGMNKAQQERYFKMHDPLVTIKYLNETIYSN